MQEKQLENTMMEKWKIKIKPKKNIRWKKHQINWNNTSLEK